MDRRSLFFEKRFGQPQKVNFDKQVNIVKVACGYRHTMAITD